MDNTSEQNLFLNRYVFGAHVAEGGSAKIFKVSDTWFPERKLIAKVQRDDDPRLGRALQREYATLLMHRTHQRAKAGSSLSAQRANDHWQRVDARPGPH